MSKYTFLLITLILSISTVLTQAQTDLALTLTVLNEDVAFIRANTSREFNLPTGAITPFGTGDTIRTGDNGRALIQLDEQTQILLLPDTAFTVQSLLRGDAGLITFEATLEGIALHDFDNDQLAYQLQADTHQILFDTEMAQFGVWARSEDDTAVIVQTGQVTSTSNGNTLSLENQEGIISSQFDTPILLDSVYLHPVQIVAEQALCEGVVATNGGAGLRLRAGAALDYIVVGLLNDGDVVSIVGTTENSLWYRIPDGTSYGWIFSNLVEAECDALPEFANLTPERPERVLDVTPLELTFLQPYYGLPQDNIGFYR